MNKKRGMLDVLLLTAAITSSVFSGEWKANIERQVEALVDSCVVVPCSFKHPKERLPSSRLNAIWYRSQSPHESIYAEDPEDVVESFRGRTQLLGNLGQENCTLEITDIKDHDNGPFCLQMEITETQTSMPEKHSFANDCVQLIMLPDPVPPTVKSENTAVQHHPHTITCSVFHTCPSHPPTLTWSRDNADGVSVMHTKLLLGRWQLLSIFTFTPEETDDHTELTCTAHFNGKKTSSTTHMLYVKRTKNYHHIIIPIVVAVCTAVIFGVVCIFMVKKYKQRIAELQSRDGSVWNRLSRLSRRIRSGGSGPSHAHRQPVEVVNNAYSKPHHADPKISKARFPSPKSLQKSSCSHRQQDIDDNDDDYMNTADLSIYGNI